MSLIPIDEVVFFDVVTHVFATGVSTNADSSGTFEVYEESTDTAILTAQALVLRAGATGVYRGSFTASAANGFEAGKWYSVVASSTVSSVAGKCVVMGFRVAPAESVAGVPKVDPSTWDGTDITTGVPLAPTVAGRTLDVSAGGEAGLDWANIGSPTTAQNLSATNIDVDQVVASVSGAVGSVTGAVGSVAAGGITAASIATGAIDADALAADAVDEIWDEVMEGSTSARQSLRLANSANGAKTAGMSTATGTIRDLADSKDRVTATLDGSGNRTAVTLDLA